MSTDHPGRPFRYGIRFKIAVSIGVIMVALMAVDINSGKISGKGNFEAMAFKTNMEAAETIARQLKLRDVGGQVVIDFIEMRDKKHVLDVEKTLRQAMKNDRARHDVARMSSFGLLELVRQRMGSSALAITMEPCPACGAIWNGRHCRGCASCAACCVPLTAKNAPLKPRGNWACICSTTSATVCAKWSRTSGNAWK